MREISYLEAFYETLHEEMLRDPSIFILGLDMRILDAATSRLYKEFGERRVIDAPISEYGYTLAAMGSAMTGMRPVVDFARIEYSLPAFDAIFNQIPKKKYMSGGQYSIPVVIRTMHGPQGGMGPHHSQSLESLFIQAAGMVVAVPSTPYDLRGLMKTALRGSLPVLFCEHVSVRGSIEGDVDGWNPVQGPVPEEDYAIPFGKADIKRVGRDVTVIAITGMLQKVLTAAEELARDGINAEVIDPRTLVPLDKQTIVDSVAKTRKLVVAEESNKTGGIGAEITATVAEALSLDGIRIKRLAAPDAPAPYGLRSESLMIPGVDEIVDTVRAIVR